MDEWSHRVANVLVGNRENEATMEVWFSQHFQMHNNQNAILGIAGTLDIGVDWETDEHLQTWILDNWLDHVQACQILGIG